MRVYHVLIVQKPEDRKSGDELDRVEAMLEYHLAAKAAVALHKLYSFVFRRQFSYYVEAYDNACRNRFFDRYHPRSFKRRLNT